MATKKQKREAALAKREAYMAEVKAQGLEALRKDREWRAAQTQAIASAAKTINDRHQRILSRHGIKPGTGVAYDTQKSDLGFPQDTDQDYIDRAKRFAEAFEFGEEAK